MVLSAHCNPVVIHNEAKVDDLLAFALNIAKEAGDITMRYFRQGVPVDHKDDDSPVTIADCAAERHLRLSIEQKFSNHGLLGEEEGAVGDQSERWVIDPIDGTKSFICGVPLYGVLLSYERDGVPVIGVCHFPAIGDTVWAVAKGGAFINGVQCRVSTISNLSRSTLCVGSHKTLADTGRLDGVMKLAHQAMTTRTWGDAYGHCLVATGRAEAMLDPKVSYHDLSAVSLIVSEAGGRFTDFDGQPGISDNAISCNVTLQQKILGAFR